ncbi:baculoviral IAP repeat-containing protein 1e-like [Protopterus annectens]|uniref:baculoviral IAP repeat-containing protein 1e-like n=1 Tax=Protopterus annectens TaxID=7888 RepID=UPI001CFBD258|nr:baculoviral IAP repeat-containing protein 1e-like [Protopterus annectens]
MTRTDGRSGNQKNVESRKRQELIFNISSRHITDIERQLLQRSTILPKLKNLKFLRLRVKTFWNAVIMENFVRSLGALEFLEEVELPPGSGVACVVDTLLQQLQHLKYLQILALNENMNDRSLLQVAKASKDGKLSRIRSLHLICNTEVTDAGWHDFFQHLDNMYHLRELNISLLYMHPMKPHPSTIKALAQCILRLPHLLIVFMFAWLVDVADQKLLNDVKANHPQSKCINIFWQQPLPCLPVIEKENF